MIAWRRLVRPVPLMVLAAFGGIGGVLFAQIEGGERGVPPIDSSSSFEVSGINVDVSATTAEAARLGGWREAQRRGWQALWRRVHGGADAPDLSDSALDGIVAGIIVEREQIGPRRYVAQLGVLFDRARTGQILGITGRVQRSAPMLVIPVQWSGGRPQVFETRTEWQHAWARFRTGNSAIDYVRPSGTGVDPLLLNAAQVGRPGRTWWRMLLDSYGAADVLVPQVRLDRLWPGGPVIGHFSAYHGPDKRLIGEFRLRVESAEAIPRLLDEGIRRIDEAYVRALGEGRLAPDPSLVIEDPVEPDELGDELLGLQPVLDSLVVDSAVGATTISVQFETPDVASVGQGESALRAIPGVSSAATTSLALGGISVMRVGYQGDIGALAAALEARGWQVQRGNGTLRIVRGGAAPTPPAPDQ